MLPTPLLQTVRELSIQDKLLLVQTVAYMIQKELTAPENRASEQLNGARPEGFTKIMQEAEDGMRVRIAELLSRPKPTPEQMLPYGLFKGELNLSEEDFRAAEWHPSEEELSGS
jgi:hypothetical protein